jgi:pimeloyl-ACP methyl ester carboxylesterase
MAQPPQLHHVQCLGSRGLHRMAYWQWGAPELPHVVVCVHGLTRQGRDFDTLARQLGEHPSAPCRVVCPDVAGRGHSDWLADPTGYALPHYVADMVTLLARLNAQTVDWVGTSMGGLIGLGVAALAGSPLRRLVLNDVGPTIEYAAIERIRGYVGLPVRFASVEEGAAALWEVSQGFGPHSPEDWLALTRPQLVPDGSGGFKSHYDPAIAHNLRLTTPEVAAAGEAALWTLYDSLTLPVLLLRGAESDLLSPTTARAMQNRGPRARLVEFAGVGHAPTLVAPEQRRAVLEFLHAS